MYIPKILYLRLKCTNGIKYIFNLVVAYILLSINRSHEASIMRLRKLWEVWKQLRATYASAATAAFDIEIVKLKYLKTKDNETVVEYANGVEVNTNCFLKIGYATTEIE